MPMLIENFLNRFSLPKRFMIASFVIIVAGVIGIGLWVGQQIEIGVVRRTAATTALYMDSFISPELQELSQTTAILPQHIQTLTKLLHDTSLGRQTVVFKVWGKAGQLLYSTDAPTAIGHRFPMEERLQLAWAGEVTSRISSLDDEENVPERVIGERLLEIYSPVRLNGTNHIIAVAEFYQTVDELQGEINAAQIRSWLVIGSVMLVMYLLLAVFVKRTSDTIDRQQVALNAQVSQLTDLLAQNEELHERVRRAAAKIATLNERFLRRIGSELHDGPAQELSLAILELGKIIKRNSVVCRLALAEGDLCQEQLDEIQTTLQQTLKDIRAIAAGLGLPHLQELSLAETVIRVVRAHERRTRTKVTLILDDLLEQVSLPVKITLYRFVQEALNNAYRHAGGVDQQVTVSIKMSYLNIEVSDHGPGFDVKQAAHSDEHLGLAGMHERAESLGGFFQIKSEVGQGTKVMAQLPFQATEGNNYE
ncbi:MAG: sensor histidine kinase [Anaerolineae bacterium]